ncbi:MAG: Fe-S cluster assembly sulfur transfer protein SufU [Anaeroplasmataceae bacterium]
MKSDNLEQLYRDVIMDHYKNPKNKGLIKENGYHNVHINNPSCGDDINICIKVDDNTLTDIRHDGTGCSICCSSASVMSETLKNKKTNDALKLVKNFYTMIKGEKLEQEELDSLEEAIAYTGVSSFPARIKCATLSWKAVEKAIEEVSQNNE